MCGVFESKSQAPKINWCEKNEYEAFSGVRAGAGNGPEGSPRESSWGTETITIS